MKSLLTFSLSIFSASLLVACSSGGKEKPIDDNKTQATYGGVWEAANGNSGMVENPTQTQNFLSIDGEVFNLASEETLHKYKDITYGKLTSDTKRIKSNSMDSPLTYRFVYGKQTLESEMPRTGVFNYVGPATVQARFLDALYMGGGQPYVDLTVDFQNKTVKGDVFAPLYRQQFKLPDAVITGNNFEGKSNDRSVKGQFFGDNASHLGGVYSGASPLYYSGEFVATKQ